jgi:hypothetical protein
MMSSPEYDGTDVPYDTPFHRRISDALWDRVILSKNAMSDRCTEWGKIEDWFRAYIPASQVDTLRKQDQQDGVPQYVTLEIPYSYATVLTAHTYITSTFFARDPVFQVQGRHGESQNQELGLEAILSYQFTAGFMQVPMYIWMLDGCKYGLGVMGQYWQEDMRTIGKWVVQPKTFLGVPVPGKTEKVWQEQELCVYRGIKCFNVRPQDWLPDPRVTITEFQKGEFCGRYIQMNLLDIVSDKEQYINVEFLKKNQRNGRPSMRVDGSEQIELPSDQAANTSMVFSADDKMTTGIVEGYEIIVKLIPQEWGLGKGTKAEKWVFLMMTEQRIIISAKPLDLFHAQFPYDVVEGEIDGHARTTRSMLEVMKPLNDVLSWLFNTHFYNVRKSLNDQFCVDPSRVVLKDLQDPNPGKLIRLKPSAYGQDVRTMVQQFQVQDVTRSNVQDSELVTDMLQRVSGVNDNLMGMVNSGRRTATEVRSSTTFGVNRLKTQTEYWSAQGMGPFCQKMIQTTQQNYEAPQMFRVVGDLAGNGTSAYINVTPDDIAGFYDFTPVDGTLPVDRYAQVNLWGTLMGQVAQFPQIMQQYDFGKIFAFVAQLAGLKNITQFRIQVVPDQQLQGAAAGGNVIPIGAAGGGGGPAPTGMATPAAAPGPGLPLDQAIPATQIPGMGPSG